MYDLIIAGGGPAGLTAAVYACRKKLNSLLVSGDIGGQPNTTGRIENYLGYQFIEGPDLVEKFQAQVDQFHMDQKIGYKVTRVEKINGGFEVTAENGERYQAKAVIFATGKSPRKLNVPGEVEYAGRGVTYCATCDGPIFAGQKVAVIGGGNSALGATLDMAKIAEQVYMVSLTKLTGDAILIDRLKEFKNITVFPEHQTVKITGEEFTSGIVIKDRKSGKEKKLDVTGVFIEIGLSPNSAPVKELVKLNELGEVIINCSAETSVTGLFAAGDVTTVPDKQIVIAAGEGAKAALRAHNYLQRLGA